jgi:hypothetical protein
VLDSAALEEEPDVDKDEVVASIMGAKNPDSMSPAAQQYKDKLKEQIAKVCTFLEAQQAYVCTRQQNCKSGRVTQTAAGE